MYRRGHWAKDRDTETERWWAGPAEGRRGKERKTDVVAMVEPIG